MWSLTQFKEYLGGKSVKRTKSRKSFPEAEESGLVRPKTAVASDSVSMKDGVAHKSNAATPLQTKGLNAPDVNER